MAVGLRLSPPLRFRFTDEADVAAYGDQWWVWDEQAVTRLRGRELIELEEAVDQPIPLIVQGLRANSTLATMAAMWIAMHLDGHPVRWVGFNPLVLTAEWEAAPERPLESGGDPTTDSDSSPEPTTESATS